MAIKNILYFLIISLNSFEYTFQENILESNYENHQQNIIESFSSNNNYNKKTIKKNSFKEKKQLLNKLEAINYKDFIIAKIEIISNLFLINILLFFLIICLMSFFAHLIILWTLLTIIFLLITTIIARKLIFILWILGTILGYIISLTFMNSITIMKFIISFIYITLLMFLLYEYNNLKNNLKKINREEEQINEKKYIYLN